MKLEEMIAVIQNPDRVRIFKDKERLFMGFRAALIGGFGKVDEVMIEHGKDEVKSFRACPEITHKQWKKRTDPTSAARGNGAVQFQRSSNVAVLRLLHITRSKNHFRRQNNNQKGNQRE